MTNYSGKLTLYVDGIKYGFSFDSDPRGYDFNKIIQDSLKEIESQGNKLELEPKTNVIDIPGRHTSDVSDNYLEDTVGPLG